MNIGCEFIIRGSIQVKDGEVNKLIKVSIPFEASNRSDAREIAQTKMQEIFVEIGKSEIVIITFKLKLYEVHECAEWTGELKDDLVAVNLAKYRDVENRRYFKVKTGLLNENWQILLHNAGGDQIVAFVMHAALVGRQTAEKELLRTEGDPYTAIYDLEQSRKLALYVKRLNDNPFVPDPDIPF